MMSFFVGGLKNVIVQGHAKVSMKSPEMVEYEYNDFDRSSPSSTSCLSLIDIPPVLIEGTAEHIHHSTKAIEPTIVPKPFLPDSSLTENDVKLNKHNLIVHNVPAHPLDGNNESNGKKSKNVRIFSISLLIYLISTTLYSIFLYFRCIV